MTPRFESFVVNRLIVLRKARHASFYFSGLKSCKLLLIVIILLCFSLVNKSYIIILKNIYTLVNQYISKEMLSHTAVQQHCSPARVQAKGNQKFQEREVNTFERFSLWKIMAWPLAVPGQFFRSAPPVTTKHLSSEWRTMRCHLEERCILALFPFHPTAMRTRH